MHAQHARSHLFTLRVWPEEVAGGGVEWRGKVQHVENGETLYFRDWQDLTQFLLQTLDIQVPEWVGLPPPREETAGEKRSGG